MRLPTVRLLGVALRLVLVASLISSSWWLLPGALSAARLLRAADDPAALAAARLEETVTEERIAAEIDAALAAADDDLAASLVALADRTAVPVDGARRARVAAATAGGWMRTAGAFATGFAVGTVDDAAGLAGAVAGDLTGYGDVRDLGREGLKAARGETVDEVTVGLALAGLAVTGATWGSFGATAPVRAGLSAVKAAARAGRLSAGLVADLARMARRAAGVGEPAALRRALAAGDRSGLAATARAGGAAPLLAVARDLGRIGRAAGPKAARDALALAGDAADIGRTARLADRFGDATRATLKLLGRGALVLGRAAGELMGLVSTLLGALFALASAAASLGRSAARLGRKRTPGRTSVASPAVLAALTDGTVPDPFAAGARLVLHRQ